MNRYLNSSGSKLCFDGSVLATVNFNTSFLKCNGLAIWSSLGLAAGAVLDLAVEGVGHPHVGHLLRLVVPNLLTIGAVDLGDDELDGLGNQLALLPGDGLAGLITGPNLFSLVERFVRCETIRVDHRIFWSF